MNQLWATRICGMVTLAIGGTVLLGWVVHDPTLIQIRPDWVAMVFNTALCLSFSGLVLALAGTLVPTEYEWLRRGVAVLLIGLGALTLIETVFDLNLGIDWVGLHRWLLDSNPRPGRMAPNSSVGFVLLGIALALPTRRDDPWLRHTLCGAVLTIGLTGIFGYFLKLEFLYSWHSVTRMALHTAIGFTVLGFGLWTERNLALPASSVDDSRGILSTVAAALIVGTLSAGLGAFAFMQHRLEAKIGEDLQQSHRDRAQFFASVVLQSTVRAETITTRPNALIQLRKAFSDRNDTTTIRQLQAVAKSYLPHGFTWVAFYQNGRLVTEAGAPAPEPRMDVSLRGVHKRELVWHDGYYLRTRLPMHDQQGPVGIAVAEQPLEVLNQLGADNNQLGQTGEMVICDLYKNPFRCFPERFLDRPFEIPHTVNGRRVPMAYAITGSVGTISTVDFREQQVLAAYGPVGDSGLGMVLKMDWAEIYAPVREQLQATLLVLLVFVALSLWLVRSHVQPLLRQLVESRRAALTNEARFLAAAENNPDGFYLLESVRNNWNAIVDFRFVFLNENGARLISPLPKEKFLGQNLCELLPLMRTNGHLEKYREVVETGNPLAEEFSIAAPGVKASWLSQQVTRLGDGIAINARDVSDRKTAEQQLKFMAENDPLTGLANRASFLENLREAMSRAKRRDRWMALFYLDIDHFKRINDSLGHAAGDELLRVFAQRLQSAVRTTDTVARLGGDEFTVILLELRDIADAEVVARKIDEAVRRPLKLEGQELTITSSIGIALYREETLWADELIRRADSALYRAKSGGRGSYAFYAGDGALN